MKLFTAEQMQAADRHAVSQVGISGIVLMENAGVKILFSLEQILGDLRARRFVIVCGKGNNGGDGLVIARHLINRGISCKLFMTGMPKSPDARQNYQILKNMGIMPVMLADPLSLQKMQVALEFSDVLIDCVFGTGFKGNIEGLATEIIKCMNDCAAVKFAVDMPSGVCATTGKASDASMIADYTLSLAAAKVGQFLYPGIDYCGEVWVVDIGLPVVSTDLSDVKIQLMNDELCRQMLPVRNDKMHKGDTGRLCIIAGSHQYQGAAVLASYGALRSGAGLVNLVVPECLRGNMSSAVLPEVILSYLPAQDGKFAFNDAYPKELIASAKAVLAGPGWGVSKAAADSVRRLIEEVKVPLVLDADALCQIDDLKIFSRCGAEVIITPHPKEMAKLAGLEVAEVCNDLIGTAAEFAQNNQVVVVLKSSVTTVADPNGQVFICSMPNSGLARGGSGDVLAGLTAGLAATGVSAINAAACAVYILAQAAEISRKELGVDAMTLSEVAGFIPLAFRRLRNSELKK